MTLTKADIVRKIYMSHDGITKAESAEAVETLLHLRKNT